MTEDATPANRSADDGLACMAAIAAEARLRSRTEGLSVLVVEDEVVVALAVKQTVEGLGHHVCGMAATEADAVSLARAARPDVALMDVRLAGPVDGIEAARRLRAAFGIRSIFLSGYADHATMSRVTATYPLGVVHKPFSTAQLKVALDLAARRLARAAKG